MEPLIHTFLKSTNSLILLLIAILGFTTSCEDEPAEYGTPTAYFVVIGEIKSADTNQPIPDIIVEMRHKTNVGEGFIGTRLVDTNFSDALGRYGASEMSSSNEDRTYQIKFTDTDGRLNGEFETLDTTIVFQDPKFTNGDGSWYLGSVEKEINIQLKPKE